MTDTENKPGTIRITQYVYEDPLTREQHLTLIAHLMDITRRECDHEVGLQWTIYRLIHAMDIWLDAHQIDPEILTEEQKQLLALYTLFNVTMVTKVDPRRTEEEVLPT